MRGVRGGQPGGARGLAHVVWRPGDPKMVGRLVAEGRLCLVGEPVTLGCDALDVDGMGYQGNIGWGSIRNIYIHGWDDIN